MRLAAALALAAAAARSIAAAPLAWQPLMPDGKRAIAAICASGPALVAVGERAFRSPDGATWDDGFVLAGEPHRVGGASGVFCRGALAWAAGNWGQIWRSDGSGGWTLAATPKKRMLSDVGGNASLVIAVGEQGTVLVSRDGLRFTVEPSGTRAFLRRVVVAADGGAVALGDDGFLYLRGVGGGWHPRPLAPGVALAAVAGDGKGGLHVLAGDGRRWRSDGDRWLPEAALDPGPRGGCDELAMSGARVVVACRRATGNLVAMEPPMQSFLLVSDDGGARFHEEPVTAGVGRMWSLRGAIHAGGDNVYRLASAPPTP